jgi:RNA polymerase sigma factor (sigma-70 family)
LAAARGFADYPFAPPNTRELMPHPRTGDLELVSDFKAGSESAARELFDRYCARLMRLAKRRIGQRLVSRVDPEDVLQSAFRTFFNRVRNDEFSFHEENDLFKLLVRLTVHKTLRQIAFHRAAKRNPELEADQCGDACAVLQQISADEPEPETAVALVEEFERFVGQFPPLDRQVLGLKLQGYSTVEIAERIGSYDRKVRRILERIQSVARGQTDQSA